MREKFEKAKKSEYQGIKLLQNEIKISKEDVRDSSDELKYTLGLEISSSVLQVLEEGISLSHEEFARLIMSLYSRGYNSMEIDDMMRGLRALYGKEVMAKRSRDSRHKPRNIEGNLNLEMPDSLLERKFRRHKMEVRMGIHALSGHVNAAIMVASEGLFCLNERAMIANASLMQDFVYHQVERVLEGKTLSQEDLEKFNDELSQLGYGDKNRGYILKALRRISATVKKGYSRKVAAKSQFKIRR